MKSFEIFRCQRIICGKDRQSEIQTKYNYANRLREIVNIPPVNPTN